MQSVKRLCVVVLCAGGAVGRLVQEAYPSPSTPQILQKRSKETSKTSSKILQRQKQRHDKSHHTHIYCYILKHLVSCDLMLFYIFTPVTKV